MTFILKLNKLRNSWLKNYDKECPEFDYQSDKPPHTLIFLESPGPIVPETKMVSLTNGDPTANELKRLIKNFDKNLQSGILLWNAVPWLIDNNEKVKAEHIEEAKKLHEDLLQILRPELKYVLLLGAHARKLLPYLSPRVGDAHIYGGHHTGGQAQKEKFVSENELVFKFLGDRLRTDCKV